ncbi:MAG: GIY-YIG nuclease family protein [bacterium]
MYSVYILQSIRSRRYYIGSAEDANKRLAQHNSGGVISTRLYKPWKIVYTECFQSRSDALKREKQMKSWKKRAAIEKLIRAQSIEDPRSPVVGP